jgi:Ca2+-binding RTX toxin-like protein
MSNSESFLSVTPLDNNLIEQVELEENLPPTTTLVSIAHDGTKANNSSYGGSISADGRYVVFDSWASNLTPGDTNERSDIFVRDRGTSFSAPDSSKNMIEGTPEKDFLLGTPDGDFMYGFQGDDTLMGTAGNDILYGSRGNDTLFGNDGNDSLFGGDGRDSLFGNSGDDILDGGADDDWLSGGSGADRFVLREKGRFNTIVDYVDGTDSFLLDGGLTFEKLTISQNSCRTVISVTETNEELAVLVGVEASIIGAEDFTTLV